MALSTSIAPARNPIVIPHLADERWAGFVGRCSGAGPFHHPAWAQLLAECYGYRAFGLTIEDGGGAIVAGLPVIALGALGRRRWLSLPFTDSCPPLSPVAETPIVAALHAARRDAGVRELEVRAGLAEAGDRQHAVAVIHTLELDPDPMAVFRTFHRSQVQRNIGKAERSGVTVRRAERVSDLTDVFYGLHLHTRRRQGTPVQPRRFFALLWERLVERGLGSVLLAYTGDVPVAGAVFLHWNNHVVYKFGASDPSFWKLRPNHVIFWEAIRTACESGYHTLDFGRTDLDNRGLRDFKRGWGAREEPLVYTHLGDTKTAAPRYGGGKAYAVLGTLIRRSPTWVCRVLGEMLYRYAA